MSRRRRRVSGLSLFYFVVVSGLLVGGSLWLDRRGETASAVVKSKHEEIIVHRVPRGGWDRYFRVGVEFGAEDGQLGRATVTVPESRYDALHAGDSIQVHYPPFFPLLARAADRTTGQVVGDLAGRFAVDPWLLPFLFWLIGGIVALWLASRVATAAVLITGIAWIAVAFPIQFPAAPPLPPVSVETTARVTAVTLVTKAPSRTRSRRRSRVSSESVRRLAMPYEVVQLQFTPQGPRDTVVAVDAVDSASVAGLAVGAIVSIVYDPQSPREARMTVGSRSYRDRNRYHFLVPMVGVGLLGMLGAWGSRHRRTRGAGTASPANASPVAAKWAG